MMMMSSEFWSNENINYGPWHPIAHEGLQICLPAIHVCLSRLIAFLMQMFNHLSFTCEHCLDVNTWQVLSNSSLQQYDSPFFILVLCNFIAWGRTGTYGSVFLLHPLHSYAWHCYEVNRRLSDCLPSMRLIPFPSILFLWLGISGNSNRRVECEILDFHCCTWKLLEKYKNLQIMINDNELSVQPEKSLSWLGLTVVYMIGVYEHGSHQGVSSLPGQMNSLSMNNNNNKNDNTSRASVYGGGQKTSPVPAGGIMPEAWKNLSESDAALARKLQAEWDKEEAQQSGKYTHIFLLSLCNRGRFTIMLHHISISCSR